MDLVERSLQAIEWPEFLLYYKGLCYSPLAASRALALTAPPNQANSEELLRLTTEAIQVVGIANLGYLASLEPLQPQFHILEKQGCLATSELFSLQKLVRSGIDARNTAMRAEVVKRAPQISSWLLELADLKFLNTSISEILSEEGEIRENASETLAKLFQKRRKQRQKAMEIVQRELRKAAAANLLQDSFVDTREGKYVLPVRSDKQTEFPGTIVERSASKATVFMEPLAVKDLNSEILRIDNAIEEEIYRILRTISLELSNYILDLQATAEILCEFDLTVARAKVAIDLSETLDCSQPSFSDSFNLDGFFHPLLKLSMNADEIITNELNITREIKSVLISGPNTGGKTVVLKAVGLMAQMAKCGFHIPCRKNSTLPYFSQILCHIGDEQSIELSLSSFSSSVLIAKEIIERADASTLVLIDEIFASTDPREGAALSASCIKKLIQKEATVFVTTHFTELKELAEEVPTVVNASMQFDQEAMLPRFRLVLGVPGKSWALETASRFGIPIDVITEARRRLGDTHEKVEALISQLHREEDNFQKELSEVQALKLNLVKERAEVKELAERIREKTRTLRNDLREEYGAKFRQTMRKAEDLIENYKSKIKDLPQIHEEMTEANRAVQGMKEGFSKSIDPKLASLLPIADLKPSPILSPKVNTTAKALPFVVGAKVRINSSGITGVLLNEPNERKAHIQAGIMKVRLSWSEIAAIDSVSESTGLTSGYPKKHRNSIPAIDSDCPPELNVIGLSSDDAILRVEEYLDQFSRSTRPSARIVHGHGSGKLKRVIREFLQRSPYGIQFRPGGDGEGGDGCTVIEGKDT